MDHCGMAGKFEKYSNGTENGQTMRDKRKFLPVRKKTILPAGNYCLFLQENHITLPEEAREGLNRMADEGMTPLLVAQTSEGRFLGVIGPRRNHQCSGYGHFL